MSGSEIFAAVARGELSAREADIMLGIENDGHYSDYDDELDGFHELDN